MQSNAGDARAQSGAEHPCSSPGFWSRTIFCGHRGAGAETVCPIAPGGFRCVHALENTLLSLELAAATPGVTFVEFDVQLSLDGVPVIHHDWCVRVDGAAGDGGAPVALRVPVGHLTATQLHALAPQPMVRGSGARGADDVVDERAWAAAATDWARRRAPPYFGGGGGGGAPALPLAPPPARAVAGAHVLSPSLGGGAAPPPPLKPPLTRGAAAPSRAAARALAALGLDAPLRGGAAPRVRDGLGLRDGDRGFPTLRALFCRAPVALGFNVELKYPSKKEAAVFGLRVPQPREFVKAVWHVVAAAAGDRAVVFSSFDPDVAAAMKRAQTRFPVLFLTMAGLNASADLSDDERKNGLEEAGAWALTAELDGVVTHARALFESARGLAAEVAALRDMGLRVATFGAENNEPERVDAQTAAGVSMIILDAMATVGRCKR
jgi:glycerophosphoryl diester phosphodiesterase